MDIRKDDLNQIPRQWQAVVAKEGRHTYLETSLYSCKLQHPDCRIAVITDSFTPFPSDHGYEVFRCTGLDPARLMFSRSQAWILFLASVNTHVVLLDSDILIQESLEPVFKTGFDAGLTYRMEEQWPINAGIQFFHRDRLNRGVAFLQTCLKVFEEKYQAAAGWGGDQDVLRDLTVGAAFQRGDPHLWHSPDGYELMMLPCGHYNFSSQGEKMPGPYPGIPVLHFKGKRKDDMLQYWNQYLNPIGSENTP
jgi:hypothetical protein